MGVIGLTSLIEVNPHLLEDIRLRDTNLIVDGNSLCHQLFTYSRIDSRFGGDYPKFQEVVVTFLNHLRSCGVEVVFIFDGLLDAGALKWSTTLRRQKLRLDTAKTSIDFNSYCPILPIHAVQVLQSILKRRSVECYSCAGEADAIVAGLANDRRAPVLSKDSDFFVIDLKFGYVPFETLRWDELGNDGSPHLAAKLYRLDKFLEHYPDVERRLLPLFAFLCGNDFSSGCNLNKFFDHLHKPSVEVAGVGGVVSSRRKRSNKGVRPMRRHCNMLAVLEWLRNKNEAEAIDDALQSIEKKRRDKIKIAIERSLEVYRRYESMVSDPSSSSGFDVVPFIKGHLSHLRIPAWFVDSYVDCEISPVLLQAAQDRRILLPTFVEDFGKPSIHDCCRNIRLVVYAILLNGKSMEHRIVECGRDKTQFVKHLLTMDSTFCDLLPSLDTVANLSVAKRQEIFFDAFQFSSTDLEIIAKFPRTLKVFACSFLFWCHSEETRVTRWQALALLSCCFWLCSRKSDDFSNAFFDFENDQMRKLDEDFDYTPNLSKRRGHLLALSDVHSFSQWQACHQASTWLDAVLMRPFGPTASIDFLFHGRIIYNLSEYLQKSKSEPLEFLFGSTQSAEVFRNLWLPIMENFTEDFSTRDEKVKRKKNRKPNLVIVPMEAASSPNVTDEEADPNDQWSLENRFRTLVSLKS